MRPNPFRGLDRGPSVRQVSWGLIAIWILVVLALAVLPGCAEGVARAVQTTAAVSDAAQKRIEDNLARRAEARDACWSMVQERVAKLRAQGDFDAAEALLRGRYPALLTERLVLKVMQDIEAGKPVDLPPDECGAAAPPSP